MTEKLEHVLRLALLSSNINITLHTKKQLKMSRKHPDNEPFRKRRKCLSVRLLKFQPKDIIKILGWCPSGPVLPQPLLALLGHRFSNGVTMKMPYGVDVLHVP